MRFDLSMRSRTSLRGSSNNISIKSEGFKVIQRTKFILKSIVLVLDWHGQMMELILTEIQLGIGPNKKKELNITDVVEADKILIMRYIDNTHIYNLLILFLFVSNVNCTL